MIVLHALWSRESELLIWGEDGDRAASPTQRRRTKKGALAGASHPFAAGLEALAEAVEIARGDLLPAAAAPAELTLLLPTRGDAPHPLPSPWLPSDRRARAAADDEGEVRLAPWSMAALSLPRSEALEWLLGMDRIGLSAGPLVAFGDSVGYWVEVAKRALEQVARGRFVPGLEREDETFAAAWYPAAHPGGQPDWFAALELAMPDLCRASVDRPEPRASAGEDDSTRSSRFAVAPAGRILADGFAALVDAAVLRALAAGPDDPPGRHRARSLPDHWLEALEASDATVPGPGHRLDALERALTGWRTQFTPSPGQSTGFRACFRLVPPPDELLSEGGAASNGGPTTGAAAHGRDRPEPWRLEFLLQARDEPSLQVSASGIWSARSGSLKILERRLGSPQETLLAELGRAWRLYPPLEEALREARPEALTLDRRGAHGFLRQAAPLLEQAGFGVIVPAWWTKPQRSLGLKLVAREARRQEDGHGLLGLHALCAYEWQIAIGDEVIDAAEFRALAELKVPLVRVRDEWVELAPDHIAAALRLVDGKDARGEMTVVDALRFAVGAEEGPAGLSVNVVDSGGWLGELLNGGAAADTVREMPEPAGFEGMLRPYQRRGLAWLSFLDRLGIGGCLADDMGLGKTPQTLALLAYEREAEGNGAAPGPTLLICPMSLVGNWQREAERFVPDLRIHVHHGAERASGARFRKAVAAADLVITTYALAARDRDQLAAFAWGRIVLDEAQNIKNSSAKQTLAVRSIPAPRRLALTGTPVENRLSELWSIFEYLNPGLLGSETAFRRRFALPIERYRDETAAESLRRITAPFILRRLKTDRSIIADLPDKLEMTVLCNLTREQATLYQATVDEMLARIATSEGIERRGLVLATMTRLKQICNHPAQLVGDRQRLDERSGKLARLEELLESVLTLGERALVFTQYAVMGELLQAHLGSRFGQEVPFLHGGIRRKEREAMVERFQGDAGPPIFLLSLKAGGTGLNLTAANHVIHFDRWWNPAVEDQATDRAFRIGQRRDVQVRKLVCVGTLEERIDRMISEKRELAERVVGSGEAWLTELSNDELRDLVRLSADAVAE